MNVLYVALGSAAGGVARWLIATALQRRFGAAAAQAGAIPFPIGTLVVNVTGSFILGALALALARQAGDDTMPRLLLMVGFCGGYTTFSTFSLDTLVLVERGSLGLAATNILASVGLSVLAALAGMSLTRALFGQPGG